MSGDYVCKKMTFKGLLSEYSVEIPKLQRDYAQGRAEQVNNRQQFVTALRKAFGSHPIELDFVYGEVVDGRFQPLDGQQRLTTIFLLHWYLGSKENLLDATWRSLLSKFSYETRASSREFCRALAEKPVTISVGLASVSELIRDLGWFKYAWSHDPTIQGMLCMLDEIHSQFKDAKPLFNALNEADKGPIAFQALEIGKIGLSDDLYIKMNARGRPLTSFESMKAQLERFMSEQGVDKALMSRFSKYIDTEWTDLIWAHAEGDDELFDKIFQNLLMAFFSARYASIKSGKEYDQEFHKQLNSKKYDNLPFAMVAEAGCIDETAIGQIMAFMNVIKRDEKDDSVNSAYKKARVFLSDHRFKEAETFDNIIIPGKDAILSGRVLFYAYTQYLIRWQVKGTFDDQKGLGRWMRVVYNLVQATRYNSEYDLARSIRSIDKVLNRSDDIYQELLSMSEKDLEGFDSDQVSEERVKAAILLRPDNDDWVVLLDQAEGHKYFNGQIGFILSIAGVLDYWGSKSNCAWDANKDIELKASFRSVLAKAEAIFNDEGIDEANIKNYSWERALLTKEDYLLPFGRNRSFCCNGVHRDISWKRFLKDHASHPGLKAVFGEINQNDVNGSLERMSKNDIPEDWRKLFVNNNELFSYMSSNRRCIREETAYGFMVLFGERLSGAHAELFSHDWYLDSKERYKSIWPYSDLLYNYPSGEDPDNTPCAYLVFDRIKHSKFHVDIHYDRVKEIFRLSIHDLNEARGSGSILASLGTLGFSTGLLPMKWCKKTAIDSEVEAIRTFFEKVERGN